MSRRPRLLFVVNVGWFFLSHRLAIARAALEAGFDVHVAADIADDSEAEQIVAAGLVFHRINVRRGQNVWSDLRLLVQLVRLYWKVRPDVVHHVTAKPIIYGGMAARLTRVATIIHAISGLGYAFTAGTGSRRWVRAAVFSLYRIALKGSNCMVVFQNEQDLTLFVDAGIVDSDSCVLIEGSGVDLSAFAPSQEPEGVVTVVLPARILRDKGITEFAEAANLLRSRGIDGRFIVAGRMDPDNPAAFSEAEFRSLCDRTGIEWLGHVDDVPELLRRAHIVCLPSYREGLSRTLIEACAAGRPIVATDVTGCREVARCGVNALTVPPQDSRALAEALGVLIGDASLRRRFGEAGRRIAEQSYDVKSVVARTLALYGTAGREPV